MNFFRPLFILFLWLAQSSFCLAQFVSFAFWQQRQAASLTCPAGFVKVPKNTDYVAADFCVMKYEAKAETNTGGRFDPDGHSVSIASYKPASVANDQP